MNCSERRFFVKKLGKNFRSFAVPLQRFINNLKKFFGQPFVHKRLRGLERRSKTTDLSLFQQTAWGVAALAARPPPKTLRKKAQGRVRSLRQHPGSLKWTPIRTVVSRETKAGKGSCTFARVALLFLGFCGCLRSLSPCRLFNGGKRLLLGVLRFLAKGARNRDDLGALGKPHDTDSSRVA